MSMQSAMTAIRRFAQAMTPSVPPFDEALAPLRALLAAVGEPYLLVGGVAVIHHGYVRATVDLDVLITRRGAEALDPLLKSHDFVRESRGRLRHRATNVAVDLLIAGDRIPRPGQPPHPEPSAMNASLSEPDVISLEGLFTLKLAAHRIQDQADVVALLKLLDDASYIAAEGAVPLAYRSELARLRDEALQELVWERASNEE